MSHDPLRTTNAVTDGNGADTGLAESRERARRASLADVSNAVVALKKRFYGKGPTGAKCYLNDDYLFVVLDGGLTQAEETLLAAGEEELVRTYRLRFQEAITAQICAAVQEHMERRVLGYHSQIVFNPPRVFEIFVLEPSTGNPAS
jgi:uncharacterized protein YbcI